MSHKCNLFFAAASVAVLTGCSTTIMNDRPVVTLKPENAPQSAEVIPAPADAQPDAPAQTPAPQAQPKYPTYAPMTGVSSSGGVDKAPRTARRGKAAAQTAVAPGGVYVVKRGDSPARIAYRFKIRVSDLMKANNLTEATARRIQIGQKLVIPARSTAPKAVRGKSGAAAKANAGAGTLTDGKYTVKRGDSPERIARRFKIKVSALMAANNLTEATARRIQVGQKLIIPGSGAAVRKNTAASDNAPAAQAAAPAAPAAAAPAAQESTAAQETTAAPAAPAAPAAAQDAAPAPAAQTSAVVTDDNTSLQAMENQHGEVTVAKFAELNKVTVDELISLNPDLKDKRVVSPGQWVILPPKK